MINENKIQNEIFERCGEIMKCSLMQESKEQVHHNCTTLYDHIMRVAEYTVLLCDECEAKGIPVDRQRVITAAVCHDLGIVGRARKFKSDTDAWVHHASCSVDETKKLLPGVDDKTLKIIEKHMWPITPVPPTCVEEWIILQADKKAWAYELLHCMTLKRRVSFA